MVTQKQKVIRICANQSIHLFSILSVLNVKAVIGAFNQEKALVGAFSVIEKTGCGTDGALHST